MSKPFSQEHIDHLRTISAQAYHDSRFEGNFELYWKATLVYRMDACVPFGGYWDAIREIKLRAWEDEAAAHAEGV